MKSVVGRAWWCMPVMTVLIKPSQENSKFKARLVYTVRYYLKKKKCTGNYKVQNWHCFWHKINRIDLNLLAYSLFCGIITFVPHNFSKISPSLQKHWGMTHLENRRVARMVDLTILCETSLKDFKCRQKRAIRKALRKAFRKQVQDQQVLRMLIQDNRITEMTMNTALATNPTGFPGVVEHSH